MVRAYKGANPKKNWVYSVKDVMRLYSVAPNTVSNWVLDGLEPSDSQRPYLFQGTSLKYFHAQKRKLASRKLAADEFKCWTCGLLVNPSANGVSFSTVRNGALMAFTTCPKCSAKVQKFVSETDRDSLLNCRNPNTTVDCQHEEDSVNRGGIGTSDEIYIPDYWIKNDRIIYKWLTYAGCYDVKTVDRHLAAIRYCERVLEGKSFNTLTTDDVAKVREDLKRRAKVDAPDNLSASSIKHIVSHLAAFFVWLVKQDGFKRLPLDMEGYLKLPKATLAAATQVKQKDFPSLTEAEDLLNRMPSASLTDQRARAIFAIAFMGVLRPDTIASLKVKHFDIGKRIIFQDASIVRAKAGKHIDIVWFPIQKSFESVVIEWVQSLKSLGFLGQDSLFPDSKFLKHRPSGKSFKTVPVMKTKHAVTQAFAIASRNSEIKYTPHAAKHTIAAERDERPLTQLERKAWSENMGHDNEQTTERYYGKLTDKLRFEVMENIGENDIEKSVYLSDDDKIALVDGILRTLNG